MPVFLKGLSLRQYRGIGKVAQAAAPFKECNFFIGANNTGKSCFLNFISAHLNTISGGRPVPLAIQEWERHLGSISAQVEVRLAFSSEEFKSEIFEVMNESQVASSYLHSMERLLDFLCVGEVFWVKIPTGNVEERRIEFPDLDNPKSILSLIEWQMLWQTVTGQEGGSLNTWVAQVVGWIKMRVKVELPKAYLIPAMRRIGEKDNAFDDYSGKGLVDKLAELQNPGPSKRYLNLQFEKINGFLQNVTSDPEIRIEVPFDKSELLVHKDSRVLPLSSLGTGIHEVVMIAAFCTIISQSIVCIEEPEVHLHPLLQKKLMRYLVEQTSNQYFIATHSASVIDQTNAAIFHVTHEDKNTHIEAVTTSAHRFRICQDLGYRASDLLQTNFIVWVEGPSDRIYLNHWISSVDSDLREGIDYSVMFYGGRLLKHLSADDTEISDFISLRRLNQNMAILIDSDKEYPNSRLNDTKKRVIGEFHSTSHMAWVTAGREIENYLDASTLEGALQAIYPKFCEVVSADRYEHRLEFYDSSGARRAIVKADKVKIAHEIVKNPAEFGVLDLREKIEELVREIVKAND